MKVTIEIFFCPYCDEATEIYLRLVNTILFADDYFVYGFGAYHLWVHQHKASDRMKYFECRLMKAEF